MADILEFEKKATCGPTEAQLMTAKDAIASGTWPWQYEVNVYFAVTGCNKTVRRADLRKLVGQAYPVDSNGLPVACAAVNVALFTPIDRTIEGINHHLTDLDRDWEMCLVLDYNLESEFNAEISALSDFLESMPIYALEVQWQITSGWVAIT